MRDWFEKMNACRSSRLIVLLVFMVTVQGALFAQSAREIGERFLEAMDDAFAERDVLAYANLLHDELTYSGSVSEQGGPPQFMSLTKPAMLQLIPQTWSALSNYTIERKDIQVTALDNGNLQVKDTYRESMTMQGIRVINEAKETITLEVDGDSVTAREIVAEIASTHGVQTQNATSLQQFAGKYAPSVTTMDTMTVEIIVGNDEIFLKNAIGLQMKLYQDSDTEFHINVPAQIKIQFAKGDDGGVDSFVLNQGGQPIRFTRLEVLNNTPRELKIERRTLITRDGEAIEYELGAQDFIADQYQQLAGERQPGDVILDSVSLDTALGLVEFELGTIFVPENRSDPQSRIIGVGFARFRPAQSTGAPPTFHLPGGPGYSFLRELKPGGPQLAGALRYIGLFRGIGDVVLVDQRGSSERGEILSVKVSTPARSPDVPLTFDYFEAVYREIAGVAVAESSAENIDLRGYTVLELADDVEDLRRALGYKKISLVGGSFGSQWSLAVIRRHPDIVARALLTGVEPLDRKSDMPSEVYAALQRIWYEAGQQPDLRPYIPPGGLTEVVNGILDRLERGPVRITVQPNDGEGVTMTLGPFDFQRDFVRLAQEPTRLLELRHGQYESWASEIAERAVSREVDFELLNELVDSSLGATPDRMALLRGDPATKFTGRFSFDLNLVTADAWPSPDVGDEFRKPVETQTPVVFVQGDWDTSTPVENALALAPYFPNSRTLIVHRGGHNSGVVPIAVRHPLVMQQLQLFLETGKADGLPVEVAMPARTFAPPDFPPPTAPKRLGEP